MYSIEDELNIDAGKHVSAMFLNFVIDEFSFRSIWWIKQISEGVIHLGLRPR